MGDASSAGPNQEGDASRCHSNSSMHPRCCGDSDMLVLASSNIAARQESLQTASIINMLIENLIEITLK